MVWVKHHPRDLNRGNLRGTQVCVKQWDPGIHPWDPGSIGKGSGTCSARATASGVTESGPLQMGLWCFHCCDLTWRHMGPDKLTLEAIKTLFAEPKGKAASVPECT